MHSVHIPWQGWLAVPIRELLGREAGLCDVMLGRRRIRVKIKREQLAG